MGELVIESIVEVDIFIAIVSKFINYFYLKILWVPYSS